MTLIKAKALASDLIDANCEISLRLRNINDWEVRATRRDNPVTPTQIVNFAATHAVTAKIDEAIFF